MSEFSRLPSSVQPEEYFIHITPDLVQCTFDGEVTIHVNVKEATSVIQLNASHMSVFSATFRSNETSETPKEIALDAEKTILTLTFNNELPVGPGKLEIKYTGAMDDTLTGFYRSKYKIGNEERYAGVTQFEATDARKAFPCWDEPAIKSVFNITITAPVDRVVLSNMNEISNTVNEEKRTKTVVFAKSPIMSTYLVAFVVGEFDFVETTIKNGTLPVRIYVPVGKADQGKFALEVTSKVIPYYEEWFDIPYFLPKVDLIAIPDFGSGAMENWGLITYRETALLIDEESSSSVNKQWVAIVIAHELAHQWFGNLVTMEWWTHLWLNEGFASWIEYLAVDLLFPEWKVWEQFVKRDFTSALGLDSLESSHPIEVEVHHPSEIDEIFDEISYSKGASVIRMLYAHLGETDFRNGLRIYLKRYELKNTITEDLWNALAEASNKPVKEIMDTWTKQTGFPVLTITEVDQSNYKIEQTRFFADASKKNEENSKTLWKIPVNFLTLKDDQIDNSTKILFEEQCTTLHIDNLVKLNANQTGFYRVNYNSPQLKKRIAETIKNGKLAATDRYGIVNDAFALAKGGIIPTSDALELFASFENETDYAVLSSLSGSLYRLVILFSLSDIEDSIKNFSRNLLKNIGQKLGWDVIPGEPFFDSLLRPVIISYLGSFGDSDIIQEAKKRFALYLENRNAISPDLRSAVYSIVMEYGGHGAFDAVWKMYKESDFQEEQERCLDALGSASDPALLQKALELSLSSDVRPQDSVSVISSVAANPKGVDLAWAFLKNNWTTLQAMYTGQFLLTSLISGVVGRFTSSDKVADIEAFFEANPLNTRRTVQQGIETIKAASDWKSRDFCNITTWLKEWEQ